jgi:hypothetical protein
MSHLGSHPHQGPVYKALIALKPGESMHVPTEAIAKELYCMARYYGQRVTRKRTNKGYRVTLTHENTRD